MSETQVDPQRYFVWWHGNVQEAGWQSELQLGGCTCSGK